LSSQTYSERLIVLGKVVRAHGRKGAVRAILYAGKTATVGDFEHLWLTLKSGEECRLLLCSAKPGPKGIILEFKDVNYRDQAEKLVGAEISVPYSYLPKTEEDEYYWVDLIGLTVVKETGEKVGTVKTLFETGAHDVLVLETDQDELMIPMVQAAVKKVDLKQGRLVVGQEFIEI
jgi:16S rRNA processing protein RimM